MLSRVEASLVDDVGALYEGDEVFYRCINSESEGAVQEIMDSGLIEQLVAQGLFPKTSISSRLFDHYSLILEHQKIGVPTYPFEWSPEMLRAAGLCVARVNDICNDFGYELKDAHPFNIVFKGCQAVFVDFGSISKKKECKRPDWKAASEFERAYIFPLYFYSKGARTLLQNAFVSPGILYDYRDYLAFRSSLLRLLPARLFRLIARSQEAYRRFACLDMEKIAHKWGGWPQSLLGFVQNLGVIPLARQSSRNLGAKLAKLRLSKKSTWSNYQMRAGFLNADGEVCIDERFNHVLDLLKSERPRHVTELACNQGVLAEQISQLDFVSIVVCCDIDEQAVDSLFKRVDSKETFLHPMVLDFMLPKCSSLTKPVPERICADMVIALAVTHHLALTQGYRFEAIFRALSRYTRRHAIVEFMPLGLWDGSYAPPLPEWYSEEGFCRGLEPFFRIMGKNQVQENRIVYLLEKLIPANEEGAT